MSVRECMGIEPPLNPQHKPALPDPGGAKSGALAISDPALASLILASTLARPAFVADTVTGTMQWATGILGANITVTTAPQLVSVTNATGTTNYGSCLVIASPGTTFQWSFDPVKVMSTTC